MTTTWKRSRIINAIIFAFFSPFITRTLSSQDTAKFTENRSHQLFWKTIFQTFVKVPAYIPKHNDVSSKTTTREQIIKKPFFVLYEGMNNSNLKSV